MFEDLRIRNRCIRHVTVDGTLPIEIGSRPTASADRLVVAEVLVAEEHIVHGSLTASRKPQGLEQGIHETLTGLHIATHDRRSQSRVRRKGRVQDTLRNLQTHRFQKTLVQR